MYEYCCYIVATHKNCLIVTIPMSTHSICFIEEIRKITHLIRAYLYFFTCVPIINSISHRMAKLSRSPGKNANFLVMLRFYILNSFPIFILLICSISVVSTYFQSECKQCRLMKWLHQKPADLDLQCFQKRKKSGFSRTRAMN